MANSSLSENGFYLGVCIIICILLISLSWIFQTTHTQHVQRMAQLGYCEASLPGQSETGWIKCGEVK